MVCPTLTASPDLLQLNFSILGKPRKPRCCLPGGGLELPF
jgi:hypothetical protein